MKFYLNIHEEFHIYICSVLNKLTVFSNKKI